MAAVRASGLVKRFGSTCALDGVDLFDRPLGSADAISLDGVAGFVEEPSFYPFLFVLYGCFKVL